MPPTPTPGGGANLLLNGSFEVDADGNLRPDNWNPSAFESAVSRSSTYKTDGQYALRVFSTTGQTLTVSQDYFVTPGDIYSLSGQLRIPTTTGGLNSWEVKVLVDAYTSGGGKAWMNPVTVTSLRNTTSDWVALPPTTISNLTNVSRLQIQIKFNTLKADVYADGFSLVKTN